jgi:hypothetical protein
MYPGLHRICHLNPAHTHLRENSDGTIASVYFEGTKSRERDLGFEHSNKGTQCIGFNWAYS